MGRGPHEALRAEPGHQEVKQGNSTSFVPALVSQQISLQGTVSARRVAVLELARQPYLCGS